MEVSEQRGGVRIFGNVEYQGVPQHSGSVVILGLGL